MAKQLKILVSGDVEGNFNQLFNRVNTIQKKTGAFDMLFCVGTFFGDDNAQWEEYKSGRSKVPISTYVLGPEKPEHVEYFKDPSGCDLCDNVTYLGRKGIYTSSTGLSLAYLSGLEGGANMQSDEETHFTVADLEALRLPRQSDTKFQGVDILLTSPWASGCMKYALAADGVDLKAGSQAISQLALCMRPRYHFCGKEGVYYERQPYRNHKVLQENARHVTRFLALAKVGNPQKKKYLYAFNIVPMKHMDQSELVKQPPDVTECPYKLEVPEAATSEPDRGAQFFYDQKALDRGKEQRSGKKRQQYQQAGPNQKKHAQPSGPCWFCLGSPEVEKHLVVSVGMQAYLALAKGGLTPDHVLITPIGHHQSTVATPTDILQEIEDYKAALRKCFKSHGKAVVFFERNYKTQHLQIQIWMLTSMGTKARKSHGLLQVVPVPQDLASELKETFQGCALAQDIELHEIPKMSDLKQIVPAGAPYFHVELPSGDKLLYRIKKGFPLQFGREALAHDTILNMPERIDWRNCKSSKEEETAMAAAFRDTFQKFDFTLS